MAALAWPGLVSVVMPVRNGAGTIGDQLGVLSRQDYAGPWELVVSDNGSTDATRHVVESWRAHLPGLRVLDAAERAGVSYARNTAVQACRGRVVAFLDADDVADPSWLRHLVKAAAPGTLVIGASDTVSLNDPVVRWWIGRRPRFGGVAERIVATYGGNMALDRAVLDAVGGWSEDLPRGEDTDLIWRVGLAGYDVVMAPDAVVAYRFRTDIQSLIRQAFGAGRAQAQLYKLHHEHGYARPKLWRVLGAYVGLLAWLPLAVVSRRWRGWWCRLVAVRAGRLIGSLRFRVLYL